VCCLFETRGSASIVVSAFRTEPSQYSREMNYDCRCCYLLDMGRCKWRLGLNSGGLFLTSSNPLPVAISYSPAVPLLTNLQRDYPQTLVLQYRLQFLSSTSSATLRGIPSFASIRFVPHGLIGPADTDIGRIRYGRAKTTQETLHIVELFPFHRIPLWLHSVSVVKAQTNTLKEA